MTQKFQKVNSVWRHRNFRDAAAVASICVATYFAARWLEIFNLHGTLEKRFQAYSIFDLIVVAFVFSLLMLVYALRRAQDFKTESRRRDASFRLLFDNNPIAMSLFDCETLRFQAVNDAAIALY